MKACLIQPFGSHAVKAPPLGLAYVTALLKKNGFSVRILDLNVENFSLQDYLYAEKPEVVGISCVVTNARWAFQIAKRVKTGLPGCFVVMGGPYPSMMHRGLLTRHSGVDAVAVGEGEFTTLELLERLKNEQCLDGVDGLIFRDGDKVKCNPPRSPTESLDRLPFPAREELPLRLYGENAGTLFTSRGCPHQCIFCSRPVFGMRWRGHSPEYVLAEMEHLVIRYGITHLSFLDDNFTYDLERAEKILEEITLRKWKLQLYFWNGIRADRVTKELLVKMRNAGCTAINYGVESVDRQVLANIRKGISLDQVESAVRLTRKLGIKANIFLMVGNPGEGTDSVDKVKRFIDRVKVNGVHVSMATPYPGTEFWTWVEKNGRWLGYDGEELLDWPIDDVEGAFPVFETPEFTARDRVRAYLKIRNLLGEKGLLI